jgi:hypothetical protein
MPKTGTVPLLALYLNKLSFILSTLDSRLISTASSMFSRQNVAHQ